MIALQKKSSGKKLKIKIVIKVQLVLTFHYIDSKNAPHCVLRLSRHATGIALLRRVVSFKNHFKLALCNTLYTIYII